MASQYARLLDGRVLGPNQFCANNKVLDLGAYGRLEVDPRVLVTGGGNLIIETAAVLEEGVWRTILTVPLGAAANMSQVNAFLRFVRWRTDQNVTGSPVVIVNIVAKAG